MLFRVFSNQQVLDGCLVPLLTDRDLVCVGSVNYGSISCTLVARATRKRPYMIRPFGEIGWNRQLLESLLVPWLSDLSLATVTALSHRTYAATARACKQRKVLLRIRKQSRRWISKARLHLRIARMRRMAGTGHPNPNFGGPVGVTVARFGDLIHWEPIVLQLPPIHPVVAVATSAAVA
jgi:hypothetical protein